MVDWPWKAKPRATKAQRELTAYDSFEKGKTVLDVARELQIGMDESREFYDKFGKLKMEKQSKVFEAFQQKKEFMVISSEMGMKLDELEELYRSFLRTRQRKEEIEKEMEKTERDTKKKFNPPYRVVKTVKNPATGKFNVTEAYPVQFDEPPKSQNEFSDFTQHYGDGVYTITDQENKKVGQITVSGYGFSDPSELDEQEGSHVPPWQRGGQGPRFGGGGGMRPRFGGAPQGRFGGGRFGDDGGEMMDPRERDPAEMEAREMVDVETRKRNVLLRAAEIATSQGRIKDAERFMKQLDPDTLPAEQRSFVDELMDLKDDKDKMEFLKLFFTGQKEAPAPEAPKDRMERIMGQVKDILPSVRTELIQPIAEALGRDSSAGTELEREVMENTQSEQPALPPGGEGSWRRMGEIPQRGRTNVQRAQQERQMRKEEVDALEAQLKRELKLPPAPDQIKEVVQMATSPTTPLPPVPPPPTPAPTSPPPPPAPPVESHAAYSEMIDDMTTEEAIPGPAEDYNHPVTEDDLKAESNPAPPPTASDKPPIDASKMKIDEKWMLKQGLPRFKTFILGWKQAKDKNLPDQEMMFSPERLAREDFRTMTKSPYAVVIGKARLLKAYRAAKRGPQMLAEWNPYVQQQAAKFESTASVLREKGDKWMFSNWEFPAGLSKGDAIKVLREYNGLKACWDAFSAPEGVDWLTRYTTEFVKCVEDDVNKKATKKVRVLKTATDEPLPPPEEPVIPSVDKNDESESEGGA